MNPPPAPDPGITAPHVLREYALLADGERGILVGPRGDFSWMCFPTWDADAVFSSLIGGAGAYAFARSSATTISAQRQLRGNLPPAFVHAVMLECAATQYQAR
jgi:hypothetical protein